MALSNKMASPANWANLLAQGSAARKASPPFVPTARVQYDGKNVSDMNRAQQTVHSSAQPLSAGGKQRQTTHEHPGLDAFAAGADPNAVDHGSKRIRHRIGGRSSGDDYSFQAASVPAEAKVVHRSFSPSSPKRAVTIRSSSADDGAEKQSRSSSGADVPHAHGLGSHFSASRASPSGTNALRAESAAQKARRNLQEKLLGKAARREPHARTVSSAGTPSPTGAKSEPAQHSKQRRASLDKRPSPQRKSKEAISCTNNAKNPELRVNGGDRILGSPSQCVQRGFGAALHQHVPDVHAFIRKFDAPYEKLIELQKIWFKNGEPPPGWQRATLPMCFQKGYGAGTAALARKLKTQTARQQHASSLLTK